MSHDHGAYLGGVCCIEDVRQRCVMDSETGCWHLRTARGRVFPKGGGRTQRIWLHGRGSVSATRAVWELAHGRPVRGDRRAVRTCESYDCANPEHIKALNESQAMSLHTGKRTPARDEQLRRLQHARRALDAGQVRDILTSDESTRAAALRFNVSQSTIWGVRNGRTYKGLAFAGAMA